MVEKRLLRPRALCLLKRPEDKTENHGVTVEQVDETMPSVSWLFIAYTAEQFNHSSNEDMEALHEIAETATRAAGLSAYWIGCSCMPGSEDIQDDVYRICDVIRGSARLCIVIGAPTKPAKEHNPTTIDLLREWGKRLWTFPEVLLSPAHASITVYRRGDLHQPISLTKAQLAVDVWNDAGVSRQLIDHYEGNLILSRLELVTIALKCLNSRETYEFLPGDHSYALMGLLLRHPRVDISDTSFQAFARLSLVNDGDQLLERLICTLPLTCEQPWYIMDDAWMASLWDIYPRCQIAGKNISSHL